MTESTKNWDGLTEAIQAQSHSDEHGSPAINYADALKILRVIDSTPNIAKLSLSLGNLQIEVERGSGVRLQGPPFEAASLPGVEAEHGPPSVTNLPRPPRQENEKQSAEASAVRTPIAGIFYRSPAPADPPFVQVGDEIQDDTVIGIVEVMKVMNNIRAGTRGIVAEICVENEQFVQFDQVIMHVESGK